MNSISIMTSALVMVAKWPGSGKSKTRLSSQLAAAAANSEATVTIEHEREAKQFAERFVHCATSDLAARFGSACSEGRLDCKCVLLYAPPVDEARAYFSALLELAGVDDMWKLLPVLASSSTGGSDLGAVLADAMRRVRAACGVRRVAFIGSDCPTLPLADVQNALARAADPCSNVAAICPATDGGYTLLALPESADEVSCFADVRWSSHDTCLSQLAALTRANLVCTVGETHADVDELSDLEALAEKLCVPASTPMVNAANTSCPRTAQLLSDWKEGRSSAGAAMA